MKTYKYGKVINAKFISCNNLARFNQEKLCSLLKEAAESVGATYKDRAGNNYKPMGATAAIILAESHYAGHTWPEAGTLCATFHTCGNINSMPAVRYIASKLGASNVWGTVSCYDSQTALEEFDFTVGKE